MLDLAQRLLESGYGILPLKGLQADTHDGAKAPLVSGGSRGATWHPSPLPRLPGSAYGIYSAPGVVVIDVDNKPEPGKPDGFASLENLPGYSEPDLDTFTVASPGGGLHLYFTGEGIPSGNGGLDGLDVRSDDGRFYTLGPGSKTPAGEYRVVRDRDLAPVPGWLRDRLLEKKVTPPSAALAAIGKEPPDKVDLRRLATSWRKRGEQGAAMASRLKLVMAGQPYEDPGSRHDTTIRLLFWIARERPHLDPLKLRDQIFEPAWQSMYQADDTIAARGDFVKFWKGALDRIASERAERAKRRDEVVKQRIYAARWGESAEAYSEDELQMMADWLDIERDLLGYHLVCGAPDGRVWFLGLDREGHPTFRGPVKGTAVVPRARDLLAPFGRLASVETYDENKSAYVLIDAGRLLQNHGFTVGGVVSTFYGNSRVDWRDELMVERTAEYARVEPVFCQEIDDWLRALCGGAYNAVVDWVSTCGDLSQAAPALWFVGNNGIGKSLLSLGVSRLFGREKPINGNRMANFNGGLRQCPVVEYEETINITLDEFKALVTSASTEVESKGVDRALVRGSVRVLCSSNNFKLFETQTSLTEEDCSALEDRLILVHSSLPPKYLPKDLAQGWLDEGTLVSHVKWLVENHTPAASNRLACRSYAGGLRDHLLGSNASLQEAGGLIAADIRGQLLGLDKCVFKVLGEEGEGELLVKASELCAGHRGWSARRFNKALAAVGIEKSVMYTAGEESRFRYSVLSKSDFTRLCSLMDDDVDELWGKVPVAALKRRGI